MNTGKMENVAVIEVLGRTLIMFRVLPQVSIQ